MKYYLVVDFKNKASIVSQNTNSSEKETFLDDYFADQLLGVIARINNPILNNRLDHLESVLDQLLAIADEYQAVMLEHEQGYWQSIEKWNDESRQRAALKWVNEHVKKEIGER